VLERSLAGKHWSVEHDGFGAHDVRVVRLCLLRLKVTNGAWVFLQDVVDQDA